ncbi:nitrate ABC transporter substrate-binding protein [Methyloradius palustris]|uniref:Nitrate ABC transporter substrate-binding protein n=2 Tax=Methyloradius palustris TaxID=2778876 RepID=A0A8D5GB83_9PROT|nr:nitrate ABC transporter substrate-binding protein [Methyloradius palustris]
MAALYLKLFGVVMLKKSIKLLLSGLTVMAFASSLAVAEDLPKTVRISVVAYNIAGKTTFMGQEVLLEQGGLGDALAKKGIKIEWVPAATAQTGPIINEGFANGSIDFASYGDLPPIILNSAQSISQLVVPWGRSSNTYLVVPANSTAKTIQDLKGKRIALHRGRPWEIAFANLAESQGLTLKDFKIVNVNPQVGAASLASGSVDAFVSLTDAYNLEDKKVGKIIWSTKNSPADWKLFGGLWGSNEFVQKYPEITQIIANSYVRASYWISQDKNREQYIKEYASQVQPESVIRRDYDNDSVSWKDRWSPLYDQALTEHYRRSVAYARESGLIQNDIDLGKLLNPRFVNQAIKDLKIDNYWINTTFQAKN